MSYTLSEIKQELKNRDKDQLNVLCQRLARFKVENKELLGYLLFEAENEGAFVERVKLEMDNQFDEINKSNLYWAKKSLRKILRYTAKNIRYSGNKQTEIELLLYYCSKMKNSGISFRSSTALVNLYAAQLKKVGKALSTLHEDLRYDYEKEVEVLKKF